MRRILLTAGLLAISVAATAQEAAPAKGADTILQFDPYGIYVTIISVTVVLLSLIGLCVLIWLFARIMVRSAQKKASMVKQKSVMVNDVALPTGSDSVVNGEVIAAIALAIKLHKTEMHDRESDVITINKVARVYSPWSSKIHGLTRMPEHIRK
ncbi:MAG: OadG family protein [Alistipes sp.]